MNSKPAVPIAHNIERIDCSRAEYICAYNDLQVIRWSDCSMETNLAIDEHLAMRAVDEGKRALRLWRGGSPTLVLGCADKPESVLDVDECRRRGVDWIKRITGGGTVLQSRGILNYSYTAPDPGGLDIKKTFHAGACFIIEGLARLGIEAHYCGISDVAVGDRKISGNAQARKWRSILLHGTVLVDLDFGLLSEVLRLPAREPDYRRNRDHRSFMTTLRELGVNCCADMIEQAFVSSAHVFADE